MLVDGYRCVPVSSVPNILVSPVTDLVAGATASGTKGWSGSIADLKMYGTSSGAAGTTNNVATNYNATVARYPGTPIDVSGLTATINSSSQVTLNWTGNASDAGYEIAYEGGVSGPATCGSGTGITIINEATVGGATRMPLPA